VSKEKIIVAYQEDNFDNPICEFPTDWLQLSNNAIYNILTEKE
jgi:hypothetical protein